MAADQGSRERILRAALDIAGREGHFALTTRRVAAEAGVNLGLLHYYFRSKEALVEETLASFLAEIRAAFSVLSEPEGVPDPEAALCEAFTKALELAVARPGIIFGIVGQALRGLTEAGAADPRAAGPRIAGPGQAAPSAQPGLPLPELGALGDFQAEFAPRVRAALRRALGEGKEELVSRRAIQLFTSCFHPLLFTPVPWLYFELDLSKAEERRAYVRSAVRSALRREG